MISRSCRCHSCVCWGWGFHGVIPARDRHGAWPDTSQPKGRMGWERAGFIPSPARLCSGGCKLGPSKAPQKLPGTVGKAAANQGVHHGISAGTARLCRQRGDFHGTRVRVPALPLLLIVSLRLFMVVNCSLLRLLCYSKCCS